MPTFRESCNNQRRTRRLRCAQEGAVAALSQGRKANLMQHEEQPDAAGPRRRLRSAGIVLLALLCTTPVVAVAVDWAIAVRTVRAGASHYAWNRAGTRFLGEDWQPAEVDPRILSLTIE